MKRLLRQVLQKGFATQKPVQENNQSGLSYDILMQKKMNDYQKNMMVVNKENQYQLADSDVINDYLVTSFFPNNYKDITIVESKNKNLELETVNYPRNCWYQIRLPFSKSDGMKKIFQRFNSTQIRIGRLMEIIDYIGVTTTYRYLYQSRTSEKKATIATACVDNMNFFSAIDCKNDLFITSYPTYVGKSTLEIQIDLWQDEHHNNQSQIYEAGELKASAVFLFVARDKNDHKKPYDKMPSLEFYGEDNEESCQQRFGIGQKHQEQRKKLRQESLANKAPTVHEIEYVHQFFSNPLLRQNKIPMESTVKTKTLLMHSQDRNLHGKIFGGYLMREAFEIGWLTAFLHSNGVFPEIYHIDDFQFIKPVQIGDIVDFEAKVCYVIGNLMHVSVSVIKIDVNNKNEKIKTNDLHLTFVVPGTKQLQEVFPLTYENAMMLCDSKRRVNNLLQQ